MTKELEALKDLCEFVNYCDEANEDVGVIEQALQRLEQIDNANPSKAVECILDIKSNYKFYAHNNRTIDYQCSVIVQSLLKSQEQEKEIDRLENQCLDVLGDYIRLKKVLEVITKKCVDLKEIKNLVDYEQYKLRMDYIYCECIDWDNKEQLDDEDLLTQEEFDLLKRWQENEEI